MKFLFEHQQKIIDDDPKKTGIFLGTGAGKSRLTLLLARGRTLIICPKTQRLDMNWEREWKQVLMYQAKKGLLNNIAALEVISKEQFRATAHELPAYDTVIVDEAHTMTGATPNTRQRKKQIIPKSSQLFEALQQYLQRTNPKRLYLVTATPIRAPMAIWAAGQLLGKSWDFYTFRSTFYVKLPMPGREIYIAKTDTASKVRLAKAVQLLGYVGRLEDYFDVPAQTYKTIYVELTDRQKQRIKDMNTEYPESIVRCGKCHMLENGVLSGNEYSKPEAFDNKKLAIIEDLAIEFPKLVIFAKYTAQIAEIYFILNSMGKKVLILDGSTKDRKGLLEDANSSDECIVIAQSQVSAGWELPSYPVMIFASLDFSLVSLIQAQGRIQRVNNIKKNLFIYLVSKGGVDEHIYKTVVEEKMDFHEKMYGI